MERFLEVYPEYVNNLDAAWEFCQGDGVVRYNDGFGYSYWRLSLSNTTFVTIVKNSEVTKWKLFT